MLSHAAVCDVASGGNGQSSNYSWTNIRGAKNAIHKDFSTNSEFADGRLPQCLPCKVLMLDNQLIEKFTQNENTTSEATPIAELHCHERLGGLLKSYSRKAA